MISYFLTCQYEQFLYSGEFYLSLTNISHGLVKPYWDLAGMIFESWAYCILRKMRKLRIGCVNVLYRCKNCTRFSPNAQYMHKSCARLYLFPQCAIYAQYLCKIVLISPMCNICTRFVQDCTYFSNAQYMRKIVLISPMRNICARFAQDCTYFSNAQYMRKICARLYLFLQCAIYAQDLRKIVLISPMHNTCARFAPDCTYFPNAQYMHKIVLISLMRNICARLYLFLQCAIYAQDLCKIVLISPIRKICARLYLFLQCATYSQDYKHYWKKYVTYHISVLNLECYSLHSYFWIATSFECFLNKHLQ